MTRALLLGLGLAALAVTPSVEAKPLKAKPKGATCEGAVRFTSDALLTLAIVRNGTIERDDGQCDEPFGKGQTWSAINRFGKVVGTVADATSPTAGMHWKTVSGTQGAHVYVRGRKAPYASAAWSAPAGEKKKVLTDIGAKVAREVEFFQSGERRFAIVVERSTFSIAEKDLKGHWKRKYHQKNFVGFPVYALRAVLDMNGDGMPEVIQHFSEDAQGHGFEVVLARKANGDWHEIASNEDTGP